LFRDIVTKAYWGHDPDLRDFIGHRSSAIWSP